MEIRKIEPNSKDFDELIRTHYSSMLVVAGQIVGHAIADEVVQEAWVSIHKALPSFEGRSSIKTWIMRITINEAKTRLRKESRYISLEAFGEEGSGLRSDRFNAQGGWLHPTNQWHDESPDALLTNEEMGDCIESNMQSMPEMQQSVFTLKDIEGLSFDDICNILDVSASNARVLLHRARLKLFSTVEHFQETGEC